MDALPTGAAGHDEPDHGPVLDLTQTAALFGFLDEMAPLRSFPELEQAAEAEFQAAMDGLRQGDPEANTPEGRRLVEAHRELRELQRRRWAWGTEAPRAEPAGPTCRCGGAADRRCLGCGRHWCARCAPESGGKACPGCGGPVWAEGETLTPAIRNPAMKGY